MQMALDALDFKSLSDDALAEHAVELAATLLNAAKSQQTGEERAQAAKIARMMEDPRGKAMTMAMSDQAFRSHRNARIADQLNHLVDSYGVPEYLGGVERIALWFGSTLGEYIPSVVIPAVVAKLRQETRAVILPSEEQEFAGYVARRRQEGTRLNLNQLGEAILGEEEAARRLDAYLALLARPDVEYISVKISSVFSQINLLAFEHTVVEIQKRLRMLYRTAMQHTFETADGRRLPKFVNLDMEEYRDLHLTVAAFTRTLDEPEFKAYRAGIVLQAYLPDAHAAQVDLTRWAMARVSAGGVPIKVRIVKGANLAMERVESALHGWELAPYRSKPEVDANYKRMVIYGLQPERACAVNLGIASHNLFDVAYGILLRRKYGAEAFAEFEMLEGMANHQARAVKEIADGLLLYAPVVKREDFHSAIAYLVRRLDENTSPENFLHDLFALEVGNPQWETQKAAFLDAVRKRDEVFVGAQRQQDRATERVKFDVDAPFDNVADTDWSLPANQRWLNAIIERWRDAELPLVPVCIAGDRLSEGLAQSGGRDPAKPAVNSYFYALAGTEQINRALDVAVSARASWNALTVAARKQILVRCAEIIAARRADLIGVMMRDAGKAAAESDVEVSEAIDFANYYARAFDGLAGSGAQHEPLGTVLVTPPWNFPFAIPAGGVLAALMAGNTVILKPAPETVMTAWHLCQALWDAGVPTDALQFVPTTDDDIGRALVTDPRVSAVILTGAYATGRMFKSWKPGLKLYAETSGKNAMIITGMADHDQAIKDLVRSAFGHAGQKCSAASLAVLEAEVYDSPAFLRQLRDAAASLTVGVASNPAHVMTTVIRAPGAELKRGLTQLEPGESWLLEPRMIDGNPNLWTPGIRLGVKRGSWYHRNECFGPVLGLMRATSLDDAIAIVNDSEFGLTSGLQSLDDREIARWRDRIEAGNAYINRGTTGAIVRRQPFGGWKRSVFGEAKAGGPNYVFSLCRWRESALPVRIAEPSASIAQSAATLTDWLAANDGMGEIQRVTAAAGSYAAAWRDEFSIEHDPSAVLGESNVFRYRPLKSVLVRVTTQAQLLDGLLATLAARTCGVRAALSVAEDVRCPASIAGVAVAAEDDAEFAVSLTQHDRVRAFGPLPDAVHVAANEAHVLISDDALLLDGRLELRHYVREQSITQTTHRYGNISIQQRATN
jgi:RHH-type transcriptional regulator, proline utilization regulon repressor / proline dehydrogenase / delta 1-pyrroline-5-carboxylate dehydrogenase